MIKPRLYEEVALTRDMPDEELKKGDVAVVVDYLSHPSDGKEGAILEVFNAVGESVAVVVVPISAIESLRSDQVLMVREVAAAQG